jgi:hypothetical protein
MYNSEFMTLTQIGELFGATSHQVGKWLVRMGLRTAAKRPSNVAFDGDFVKQGPSRGDGYNWVWHSQRTVAVLEKAGHRRIPNPPPDLVDPPKLNGPFTKRANEANGYDIENGDGSVAIVVAGEQNADFVVQLLNLADKHGTLARAMK